MKRRAFLFLGCLAVACAEQGPEAAEQRRKEGKAKLSTLPSKLETEAKGIFDKKQEQIRNEQAMASAVAQAMETHLFDPSSAQYRHLRRGRGGAVCGKYNAKNRMGAYVGFKDFVLSKNKSTIYFSEHNDGVRTELYSSFAEAYVNACANKDEARRHRAATAEPELDFRQEPSLDPFEDI